MLDVANRRWSREMLDAMELAPSLLPDVGGSTEILGRVPPARRRPPASPPGPRLSAAARTMPAARSASARWRRARSWPAGGPRARSSARRRSRRSTPGCARTPSASRARHLVRDGRDAHRGRRVRLAPAASWRASSPRRRTPPSCSTRRPRAVPAGALGLTFLPYLQGERTPHRDAEARGAFVGPVAGAQAPAPDARRAGGDLLRPPRQPGHHRIARRRRPRGAHHRRRRQRAVRAAAAGRRLRQARGPRRPARGAGAGGGAAGRGRGRRLRQRRRGRQDHPPPPGRRAARRRARSYDEPYARFKRLYPALRSAR